MSVTTKLQLCWLVLLCGPGMPPRNAECARIVEDGVAVFVGSALRGDEISPGRRYLCGQSPKRDEAVLGLGNALARLPPALRPRAPTLHLDPVSDVELSAVGSALLVDTSSELAREPSAWSHEVAHVVAHGARPSGQIGQRLLEALDEAFADYAAAAFVGTPELAGHRDLRRAPRPSPSRWALLALPHAPFDAHELGAPLAAELWKRAPADKQLASALLLSLASLDPSDVEARSPPQLLSVVLSRCSSPQREHVEAAFLAWIPKELAPQ